MRKRLKQMEINDMLKLDEIKFLKQLKKTTKMSCSLTMNEQNQKSAEHVHLLFSKHNQRMERFQFLPV